MGDTEEFNDVADIVDLLNEAGYEVVKDVHIREGYVNGEDRLVVDLPIVVGE